jgi:phage-related minor tail protein
LEREQVENRAEMLREAGADEIRIAEWKAERLKEINREQYSAITEFGVQAAHNIQDAFSDYFYDVFSGELRTAEDYFKEFGHAITRAWSNMLAQMLMEYIQTTAIMSSIGGAMKSAIGGIGGFIGGLFGGGSAAPAAVAVQKGGIFQNGRMLAFASGGIVNQPTVFPMASGYGLMGEAGPEAVLPLRRTSGGNLGVEASGKTEINIYNNVGADVSTQEKTTAGGMRSIDVYIDQAVAKKLSQFGSQTNKTLRQNFGASQQLTGR